MPFLPTYFVERPEYSQKWKTRLLTESSDPRTSVITVIHGLGAVGKSTLAAALAHDREVQAHFYDCILWATLGQQPDVLSLLSGWVQALGDNNFRAISISDTSYHLRSLLYDRAILLIVDDVWNTKDAQAFNVGGSRCHVLITTREAVVAKALGIVPYSLDVMQPEQAMELVSKKLERGITDPERSSAEALSKAVGYLPLALELAAAQVASGTSWAVMLQDIQQEVARLKTFDQSGARNVTDEASLKRLSLIASLNLSIKRLPEEEKQNFVWLGILPEDATITPKMTATLWDIEDERDASDTLECLLSKALLLRGVPLTSGTLTYRLHDLFHDLARNLLTATPKPKRRGDLLGLGITLKNAHAIFLDKYRGKIHNGLWHTLPDDGYIHQYLSWHLEKAIKIEELHQLLQEESESGSNGWFEACDRLGQTANFVTDVARAWRLAENMFSKNPSDSIALQCRYALIISSFNAIAHNVSSEWIAALVEKQLWTPVQGLTYARKIQESSTRARAISVLAPYLSKPLLSLALEIARSIQDDSACAYALIGLAPYLPNVLSEALNAIRRTQSNLYRINKFQNDLKLINALLNVIPYLPEIVPSEVLEVFCSIEHSWIRAQALIRLAPYLPEALLSDALKSVLSIKNIYIRAQALSGLAFHLSEALLSDALEATLSIHDESDRAQALSGLIPHLPEALRPNALEAARNIKDILSRVKVLSGLIVYLPNLLPEALRFARSIQFELYRAEALTQLTPQLPELLPEALEVVRSIKDDSQRIDALIRLALYESNILPEALEAICSIKDDSIRAEALIRIVPHLPKALLPKALEIVFSIRIYPDRVEALSGLAPYLPETLLPKALEDALSVLRCFPPFPPHIKALSGLAPYLPKELLLHALEVVCNLQDNLCRSMALSGLAPYLPEASIIKALKIAYSIQDDLARVKALIGLSLHQPTLLSEALEIADGIQNDYTYALALIEVALCLTDMLPKALKAACNIQDESARVFAFSRLIPYLPKPLLSEILVNTYSIQNFSDRTDILMDLSPYLSEVAPDALEAVCSIHDESKRVNGLKKLAPHLPKALLSKGLEASYSLQNDLYQAYALGALTPYLPEALLSNALNAARNIQDESARAYVLSELTLVLPDVVTVTEALEATLSIRDESARVQALSKLVPHLPETLLPKALEAACNIQQHDINRAEILRTLLPFLPNVALEALKAARGIKDDFSRVHAIRRLALYVPEVMVEALEAVYNIHDEFIRSNTLVSLVPYLPKAILPEALKVARSIQSNCLRAQVFSGLLPLLDFSSIQIELWSEILHNLSYRSRFETLDDISKLGDAIITLGGTEALPATVRAIQQVCKQWP